MICSPKTWLTVKGLVLIWHFCTLLEHREHFIEHALFTSEFPPHYTLSLLYPIFKLLIEQIGFSVLPKIFLSKNEF